MAQVGLNDLHFAILSEDTKEALTYEAPEPMVGAINATINPAVNTQELYADDQLWESVSALGKIDVEVETADLPLAIRAKILGNELKEGVLIEKATDVPPHVALGFKSLKSNGKYRYVWLLKGVAQLYLALLEQGWTLNDIDSMDIIYYLKLLNKKLGNEKVYIDEIL